MMTQTHILVGAALFARPGARWAGPAAFAGAIAPDLDVFVMWIAERMQGVSSCVIFRDRFWESPWTEVQAVSNSAPLWALIALIGFLVRGRSIALLAFGATGLLHIVGDFFLHADDARAHLQPFTGWRFFSPVSYWDPAYFGRTAMAVEAVAGAGLALRLWRRFGGWGVRGALGLTAAVYGLMLYGAAMSDGDERSHDHACVEDVQRG
ncbi:MAG: metal-dependent hydrolase [Pseudomonadota bacterium]